VVDRVDVLVRVLVRAAFRGRVLVLVVRPSALVAFSRAKRVLPPNVRSPSRGGLQGE